MKAKEATRKAVVSIEADATLKEAAQLMDQAAVGCVLVTGDGGALVGIVTDRDIAVRGVAREKSPDSRIDSVMTTDVMSLDGDADVRDALRLFRDHAFRRVPLVDGDQPVGVLTVDDLAVNLVADLTDLVRPITGEVIFGHPEPAMPAVS
jgi:CBS domain-containing protein